MAITDVKARRGYDGTNYVVVVDSGVVKIKDNQWRTTLTTAFTLPTGASDQVAFEVWPDGILEVVYFDASNNPVSKKSPDKGTTWA